MLSEFAPVNFLGSSFRPSPVVNETRAEHEATSVASSRYHVGMSLFIAHIRVETLHHIQPAVRNQSLNVMCWSPQNQLGAVWRHWNPASDKEFEQWEFCHEWSPVPVAVPRLKNKGKTKSPNGCITTKHRYLIPKKTPTRKKKETKHRNKTKHDLAFPGTLRAFLGEKEIRLEGGPMIFIVVQAVDFHFGLLPPEGGVDLAQGPPNNQKNMPESSSSKILPQNSPPLKKTEIRHLWRIYVFFWMVDSVRSILLMEGILHQLISTISHFSIRFHR